MANDTASDHRIGCSLPSLERKPPVFEGPGHQLILFLVCQSFKGPTHWWPWHGTGVVNLRLLTKSLPAWQGGRWLDGRCLGCTVPPRASPCLPVPCQAVDLIDEASSLVRSRDWSWIPTWLCHALSEYGPLNPPVHHVYRTDNLGGIHPNCQIYWRLTTQSWTLPKRYPS